MPSDMDLEKKIQEMCLEYGGLLDRETVKLLIMDEMGKRPERSIASLKHGDVVTLEGEVLSIGRMRAFKKKNGDVGRVVNITISDASGTCILTLWDEDVHLAEKLKPRKKIRMEKVRVKVGRYGKELSPTKYGRIVVLNE